MSMFNLEAGVAINLTSTGSVVTTTDCVLIGFYVNSTSSGTLVLREGGSGGTVMDGTITPAIGFHRFPAKVKGGLHATIGATLDVTFFVVQGVS